MTEISEYQRSYTCNLLCPYNKPNVKPHHTFGKMEALAVYCTPLHYSEIHGVGFEPRQYEYKPIPLVLMVKYTSTLYILTVPVSYGNTDSAMNPIHNFIL